MPEKASFNAISILTYKQDVLGKPIQEVLLTIPPIVSPTISLVICTRNRPKDMESLLKSVQTQTWPLFSLVVVDSSDDNKTEIQLKAFQSVVPYPVLYIKSKPGLTYQRNQGIQTAEADILVFTDDDTVLESDFIEKLREPYLNPEVMGVGGNITTERIHSHVQMFMRKFFLMSHGNGDGTLRRSGLPALQWISNRDHIAPTQILPGVCSYRKIVFDQFRFDEHLSGYGYMEDIDFSYRVSRRHLLIYTPFAKLAHYHSPAGRERQRAIFAMMIYNQWYLTKKNVGITAINLPFILWSYVGASIFATVQCLKFRSFGPLKGTMIGLLQIAGWMKR